MVVVINGQVVPNFAIWSAISFPGIPMWLRNQYSSRDDEVDPNELSISLVSMQSLLVEDSAERQDMTDRQSVKKIIDACSCGRDEMNAADSFTAYNSAWNTEFSDCSLQFRVCRGDLDWLSWWIQILETNWRQIGHSWDKSGTVDFWSQFALFCPRNGFIC